MGLTYAGAGVDSELRKKAKKHLETLEDTYSLSKYGRIIRTPYNILYPVHNGKYHVKTCDGVGTKVLLAQLANKHDTIGIDAVAMVVNDAIRCGAMPIAVTDMIDCQKSDPKLMAELLKGLSKGAEQAGCPLVGGEIADLGSMMGALYHINCDCIGEVEKEKIIDGSKIKIGDVIIGIPSSGVHSNGISLARKALFKAWGGKYDTFDKLDELDSELVYEVLEPTRIYVKQFLNLAEQVDILGAANITGEAYMKLGKMTSFGLEIDNFHPQPIFELIQKCGSIADEEMFKTFNMGWGFAVVVDKKDADDALQILKNAEIIGKIVEKGITIRFREKKIRLVL